ncbi:ribonuclease P protein component [Aneurinibacillus danicus]|uniref:Ribonuclease P protein component n=1 Tax=Aneurinibacillus danicus TaxID=267746 RepID=A0A511VBT2_9BACL|nr:ribonuclease P protein component [Aneurinibacillus danicus]GEN34692.1 ribonuclease P protein component [Aneurinibacillus danicus]
MYRKNRLRKNEEFQVVFKQGTSVANRQFVIYSLKKEGQEDFRVGVSVSKKMGNAVTRNRLRRAIKEAIRLRADEIKSNLDFIVICRLPAVDLEFHQFKESLYHCMKKAQLFKGMKKEKNRSS